MSFIKPKQWWESRAHPNEFPFIPRSLWALAPSKFPRKLHPEQEGRVSWYFTNATLNKAPKGRFDRSWKNKAMQDGMGTLALPYVEDILNYKGEENVAGYFNGLIMCYVQGNRYSVPCVWGWPDYGRYDRHESFFDRSGNVKTENLERCTRWGITEDDKPGHWSVSPSLWKTQGEDRIHFMLRIYDVPENPPWTRNAVYRESPQEKWLKDMDKRYGDVGVGHYQDGWGMYGGWD